MAEYKSRRINAEYLKEFSALSLSKTGLPDEDAKITAAVLVQADLRGIPSHGIAQLRRYIEGLKDGKMANRPVEKIIIETALTAVIDAGGGLGQPVSYRAMQMAIKKAGELGAGFVSVRNSNHYGIAGYYSMMALPYNCIGISMTNASPKVVPTFGINGTLGTNPISIAAPAGRERPFVLDMATSAVPLGKIEMAERLGKSVPEGWAVYKDGNPATDAAKIVYEFKNNLGGGLLPLGGEGELFGGHKGYALAIAVEIFTALFSGAAFSPLTYPKAPDGKDLPANIGHFFGAWRIDYFRSVEAFKSGMDDLQTLLKNQKKAQGQSRIYIPGEKEFEAYEKNIKEGVQIFEKVDSDLNKLAQELNIKWL